jgi:hypothetical protein
VATLHAVRNPFARTRGAVQGKGLRQDRQNIVLHWFHRRRKIWPAATAPAEAGPDFLCVGMVKAATDWLFDQLLHHPDFWIPPVKELRYLNVTAPRMDNTVRKLSHYRNRRHPPERDADLAFLKEAAALAERLRDLEKYAALFRFRGERLSGDISPGYYDLDGETIAAIALRFPDIRIVLMVREPLERVWSHLSMREREGHFDAALLADVNAFARWFAQSEVRRACFATQVARLWAQHAPAVAFRHFFFDEVEKDARAPRADIIRFLGGDPRKRSGKLAPDYNRKANLPKLPMPDPVRAFLLGELAAEIRGCADLFRGPAERWPARYGL